MRIQHSKVATENARLDDENEGCKRKIAKLEQENKKLRLIDSYNEMCDTLVSCGQSEEKASAAVEQQIKLSLRRLDSEKKVSARAIQQQTQQTRANSPKKRERVRGGCDEWH